MTEDDRQWDLKYVMRRAYVRRFSRREIDPVHILESAANSFYE
jgi:hypothetical protein